MSKKNKKRIEPAAARDANPAEQDAVQKGERDALSAIPPEVYTPEAQAQRWMKYGANVALATVVVILLAAIVVWATNSNRLRIGNTDLSLRARADLTGDSANELKPQTLQVIRDLPGEVTLVSLYPRLTAEAAARDDANAYRRDTHQRVQDILDEYRRNGQNIRVESIDPVAEPGKLDAWLGEVKRKYGRNTENYEKFVKEFPAALAEIKKLSEAEVASLNGVMTELTGGDAKLTNEQVWMVNNTLQPAYGTVAGFPVALEQLSDAAEAELEQKIPNYAGAVAIIRNGSGERPGLVTLSRLSGLLATTFEQLKAEPKAPEPLKKYAADAAGRFEAIKARADESIRKTENLGELKLDEVRRKLLPAEDGRAAPPAIAVMGENDVRVIEDRDLWTSGEATGLAGQGSDRPRLRFSGEQKVTGAILALSQPKKQKVVFVRAGGRPLVSGMSMLGPAPFGEIAERLRGYNFEVLEKDVSPASALQPNPDEPTDEELKDAIWVVLAAAEQVDPRMGMPVTGMLGERLKQHLDAGGSALALVDMEGDDLSAALKDWGIEVRPGTVVVHEMIEGSGPAADDLVEQARRAPPIFVLNEFGDHPITAPLRSLDTLMVPIVPVRKSAATPPDVKVTEIIPIPNSPPAWGETDLSFMMPPPPGVRRPPPEPAFDPAADVGQPLYGGAAAEKAGKGRLVVIGSIGFAGNGALTYPDQTVLEKSNMAVVRFPGNGELFTNSIFWLAKNERLMGLSPAAMDTARIAAVEPAKLGFIKIGLVLVLLPLLAVATGVTVWVRRQG